MSEQDYEASPYDWVADHVERYERTGGKEGGEFNGVPCIILTTTGRKSGVQRKTPLVRVPHGDTYLVVASMGGQPTHPAWYLNLLADPNVTLQDGAEVRDFTARPTEGDEHAELWQTAVAVYPEYEEYQARCERTIPVVKLEPR
ncbi:MAG: nitroreductase family deazaflavin-dependent oxidoreductase [Acidimicrobiales bacterium]|nr:nitroreductase family deazaflavin-dependent oxidoreductase [Acidimicrobiales bacterium]